MIPAQDKNALSLDQKDAFEGNLFIFGNHQTARNGWHYHTVLQRWVPSSTTNSENSSIQILIWREGENGHVKTGMVEVSIYDANTYGGPWWCPKNII